MKQGFFIVFTLSAFLLHIPLLSGQEDEQQENFSVESESENYSDPNTRVKFTNLSYFKMYPVNTFGDLVDKNLHGFSLSYLVERKKTDYNFWGFELSYNHIGSDKNTFIGTGYSGAFDIEERTSSNLWSLHFLYRVYPEFFFWRIEPYFEAALGTNMFFTTTNTTYFDEAGTTEFDFNQFNMGLSYGLNIGFTTHISGQFFINTKLGFYSGNNTTYMVEVDNGSPVPIENFTSETSQTNAIHFKLGLTYSFY